MKTVKVILAAFAAFTVLATTVVYAKASSVTAGGCTCKECKCEKCTCGSKPPEKQEEKKN